MDENNPFSNYGPDPFLPFLTNYEEQFQPTEQDSWANAHFGFDGTQDLSFFSNPGFMNSLDILRPFVPEPNQLAYPDQEPSHPGAPNPNPPGLSHPTTEGSLPALTSTPTSSGSPAPPTKKPRSTARKGSHPSPPVNPSDKESLLLNKRARNLVASAKFREKKKQREADLERTAKEMTEKALALEKKVEELEGQIKLLRSLLLDKTSL